jgi:hypothetical protein
MFNLLIKHPAMKMYGRVEVQLYHFQPREHMEVRS